MAGMYALPRMAHPVLYRYGLAWFALLTIALAATAAFVTVREEVWSLPWITVALDTLAMAYMLIPSPRPPALSWAFVGCLAAATIGWLSAWRPRLATLPAAAAGVRLDARSARSVPTTIAIMTASMAYMLAVR